MHCCIYKNKKNRNNSPELVAAGKKQFQQELIKELFDFTGIENQGNSLFKWIKHHANYFDENAVQSIAALQQQINHLFTLAIKFDALLENYFNNAELPEKNEALQKRLTGAIQYFVKELEILQKSITQVKVVTDSKVVSKEYYHKAAELFFLIHYRLFVMGNCKEGFFVEKFFIKRSQYVKPAFVYSAYVTHHNDIKNDIVNIELYKELKKKRDEICSKENLPVYLVANSNALEEMSKYLPQTIEDLKKISGFGKTKSEKLGKHFLNIIIQYCDEHNLYSLINDKPEKKQQKIKETSIIKVDTKTITYNLYKEGKNIHEIAQHRGLALSTIEGHLLHFLILGEVDLNYLVSDKHQELIIKTIDKIGKENIKQLKENLPDYITYGTIRFVLAYLNSNKPREVS